jgi:hypothetical protein
MKLLMTKIALMTACLTMSACVFSDAPGKPGALTKEAAKKITNPGEDLCDVYNWYGDGECDMFCENADPDCDIQCDAIPVCDEGFYEVGVCGVAYGCVEKTLCGTTIRCAPEEIYCLSGLSQPYQECPEGYEIVEECSPDRGECYEVEAFCGVPSLFCQATNNCDAYPSCPLDTYEVEQCLDGDNGCFQQSICGYTIYCTQDIYCDAYPTCPDAMVEVESCNDAQDIQCIEETLCGTTISCRPIDICDFELSCAEGYVEIQSCPTDTNCYEETACGKTISCMEGVVNCLAYPACPPDTKEVPVCDPNTMCPTVTMCGVTIICQGI